MLKETFGNFQTSDKDVKTRREVLLMGAMAAGGSLVATATSALADPGAQPSAAGAKELYVAKDFGHLVGKNMTGLSAKQIEQHLKLYKGYVTKSNETNAKLKEAELAGANATYSPFRELLVEQSYAINGAVYHEYYFANLGGDGGEAKGDLLSAIQERWGSYGKFADYLKAAGKSMRGWVILGFNTRNAQLECFGLDMHNMYAPANVIPVMVLDVYEHAYMIDYGIDRAKYLDAFFANLDWGVALKRFNAAQKFPTGHASTV